MCGNIRGGGRGERKVSGGMILCKIKLRERNKYGKNGIN